MSKMDEAKRKRNAWVIGAGGTIPPMQVTTLAPMPPLVMPKGWSDQQARAAEFRKHRSLYE